MSEYIRKSDILFACVFLVAAALLTVFLWTGRTQGDRVVVRCNGEITEEYPLAGNTEFSVEGPYLNVFEISNGSVRVIETTCPNKECEHMGSISLSGQSIVCVPNLTSVTIESESEPRIDAFTG